MAKKNFFLITAESVARKLGNYVALGLAGLTIWFGAEAISSWKEDWRIERERKVSREEGISKLEKAIGEWNVDEASDIMNSAKFRGFYSPEELLAMEAKINGMTKKGLYERIKSATTAEKVDLAKQYLRVYSGEQHKREVIADLLDSSLFVLSEDFEGEMEFDKAHDRLKSVLSTLEKYSVGSISNVHANLVRRGKNYVERKLEVPEKIVEGGRVIVLEGDSKEWNWEYFKDRGKTFPVGSVGKVLEIREERGYVSCVVRFDSVTKTAWRRDFGGILPFWNKNEGKKNIALYRKSELKPLSMINEKENQEFLDNLDKIQKYISN